jgi:acetoin utilization protein AcuB
MIAADIMTESPRTIRQSDPIREALDALQSMQVRHLPVVDEEGELVGMLSDRDLGSRMNMFIEGADAELAAVPLSSRRVSEFMSANVASVTVATDLTSVIETLLEQHVGAVRVVDGDGAVVGIISYVDVLRTFAAVSEADETRPTRRMKPVKQRASKEKVAHR